MVKGFISSSKEFLKSSVKFIFRFLMVVLFLFYIVIGAGALSGVVVREINRTKNIDSFAAFVDENIKLNKSVEIEDWIKSRTLEDLDKIAEVVGERASDLPPNIFFRVSSMMFNKDRVEDALFWFNLGKYRLRYDMLRCGGSKAIDNIEGFISILFDLKIDRLYEGQEGLLEKSLKRVIEFDKDHPPMNDIADICVLVEGLEKEKLTPKPEEDWPMIREGLIKSAADFLKEEKKTSPTGKAFKDSAKDH